MNRRRNPAPAGAMSLFPFLAVLICTMGALIVLLVVVVQQSGRQDETQPGQETELTEHDPRPEAAGISLQEQVRDAEWQAEELRKSRETTLQRLQEQQRLLSMTEDQTRRLGEELNRLEREAEAMETLREARAVKVGASDDVLAHLQAEIEKAQQEVQLARDTAAKNHRSFAIVPYRGPQGTDRRPIYVECLADRVVLQPEGVVLLDSDFAEPLGPDNPLAVALRATREYWLNTRVLDSTANAYPLLIVRPQGAHSYAACRSALQGWDDEFGYELVPEGMELSFPPADASLTEILNQNIRDTRRRTNRPEKPAETAKSRGAGPPLGFTPTANLPERTGSPPVPANGPSLGQPAGQPSLSPVAPEPEGSQPLFDISPPSGRPIEAASPGPGEEGSQSSANTSSTSSQQNASRPGSEAGVGGPGGPSAIPSLAETRGENWALPNSANGSIGMTRPVLVHCESGRLTLLADSAAKAPARSFEFKGSPEDVLPAFVDALWLRIESWGVAGPGAYWKPILKLKVQPGAEIVYQQITQLLDRSGLSVERR
jgi:hypothetical protein